LDKLLSDFDANLLDDRGSKNQNNFDGFSNKIRTKFLPFIGLLYGTSALFGFALSRMIIYFNLDTKNKVLRFRNDWHYLLSGRSFKFSRIDKNLVGRNNHSKFKYTRLDVLVSEKGEETTLYSGFLLDYDLKPESNNQLDKIHLIKTQRYSKNKEGQYTPKNIPGNMLTIIADRILNINYTFIAYDPSEIKIQTFNRSKKRVQGYLILMVVAFLLASIYVLFGIKIESFQWYQNEISCKPWYARLLLFFGLNIIFGVFTPFKISEKERVIKKMDSFELMSRVVVTALVIILFFWVW